eukprot:4190039-Amphidinium_carterae.1
MARFSHLPIAGADTPHSSGHLGDEASGAQHAAQETTTRGKTGRKRPLSPTPEEIALTGEGPGTRPFGAPPTEAMHAASAASVRQERASVRSNRPRSPAKKPRGTPQSQQQATDPHRLDTGEQQRTPRQSRPQEAPHSGSPGTGSASAAQGMVQHAQAASIPPPPYVLAAARRASRPKQDSTTGESYYYSSSDEEMPVQAKPKAQRRSSRKDKIKPLPQAKQTR